FVLEPAIPPVPRLELSFPITAALLLVAKALIGPLSFTLPATLIVEPLSSIIESLTVAAPPLLLNRGTKFFLHPDPEAHVMVLARGALSELEEAEMEPPLGAA